MTDADTERTSGSRPGTPGADPGEAARRRALLALAVFLAWTGFVWVGRIRNAVADAALTGSERVVPLVLSASFLVPALALVVGWVVALRAHRVLDPWASMLLRVLVAWTTIVWVVRAGDIVLGGDHEVAFVAVHVALAVVSIGSGAWAVVTDRGAHVVEHKSSLIASQEHMS